MNVSIKDTNVIILFGDGAVNMFPSLVERWCQILLPGQWKGFQFYLIASEPPAKGTLDQLDRRLVNNKNTVFYTYDDAALTGGDFYASIGDKIETGFVHLHIVCDSAGKDISYDWLRHALKAVRDVEVLNTDYTFYLIVGSNHVPAERDNMVSLISETSGSTIFVGEENEYGGRVSTENRHSATILAILLNMTGELMLKRDAAYSIGYSALNANGSELRRMRESKVCHTLISLLDSPITSVTEIGQIVDIWPEGVNSAQSARIWLENYTREHYTRPTAAALRNAWITIRMDSDLPENEALRRMKRFVDLNYTGEKSAGSEARELAWSIETTVRKRLRGSPLTACISESVFDEIANVFQQMARKDIMPLGCNYPRKTLKQRFGGGADDHLRECKKVIFRSIENYIIEKNLGYYAEAMAACYRHLAEWLRKTHGTGYHSRTALTIVQEIQSELESNESGDMLRLSTKYDDYNEALNKLNLTLSDLTRGVDRQFYMDDGTLLESEWRDYIRQAGNNAEAKLPPQYRGDFFSVLNKEFSTPEERDKFFDEYLRMGSRMYYNLKAIQSPGVSYYLADSRLTDHWFTDKDHIFKVKTDNAENLTLYPLGGMKTTEYLSDNTVYFINLSSGTAGTGRSLFSDFASQQDLSKRRMRTSRYDLFGPEDAPEEKESEEKKEIQHAADPACERIKLIPDENNAYRLYWDWKGNDDTAMVEISQYGEKVGKIAVIPVAQYKRNGNNMNVTSDVMEGKPIPAGMLTVTIRDQNRDIIINAAEVPGRRDVVRYRLDGRGLELRPGNKKLVEKLVLRTTDTDGTLTYYPLYPSMDETPWIYRGLTISDGKIMEDPTMAEGKIIPVDMGK
ncbi:MAG: hypothetical protein IKE15_09125 [Clostridia bacterium]|nr:hypothetical protein [Clostridia bacterium]